MCPYWDELVKTSLWTHLEWFGQNRSLLLPVAGVVLWFAFLSLIVSIGEKSVFLWLWDNKESTVFLFPQQSFVCMLCSLSFQRQHLQCTFQSFLFFYSHVTWQNNLYPFAELHPPLISQPPGRMSVSCLHNFNIFLGKNKPRVTVCKCAVLWKCAQHY